MSPLGERPAVLEADQAGAMRRPEWTPLDRQDTELGLIEAEPVEPEEPTTVDTAELERRLEEAYARGLEDGTAQGHEAGLAEGLEIGRREATEDLSAALRAAEAAAGGIEASSSPLIEALEDNIVALAIGVARHVIGREVRGDQRMIIELVRRAITEFPIDQPLRVRLNPKDLSVISAATTPDGEPVRIASGRTLRWVADPRIELGGCLVEGVGKIVDGRVDRALERIYEGLVDD